MNKSVLSAARLLYALLTGGSLILVSLNPALIDTVGAYTLQAGIAAAVAAIVPLGLDRSIARLRASGSIAFDLPSSLLKFRALEAIALCAAAAVAALATQTLLLPLACLIFAVSRLIYGDLEAIWIASHRTTRWLGIALLVNGAVTAIGIVAGAAIGPEAMLIFSSGGNVLAALLLTFVGRYQIGELQLRTVRSEAIGFGSSATLAVVYARVDILILAITNVDLQAVAVYGIILRVFDALALIRGSISQLEMRTLARLPSEQRLGQAISVGARTSLIAAASSVAAIPISLALLALPIFSAWNGNSDAVVIALLAIPLFMSHLATSAVVLSDERTHLLLIGSIVSAVCAVVIKFLLITFFQVDGAVAAIGLCELASFVIFAALYRGRLPKIKWLFFGLMTAFLATLAITLTGTIG